MEKTHGKKYSATFRHESSQNCVHIYDFVNEKIKFTSEANQTEVMMQRRNLISYLKEK